jgi:hypothetical protein
VPALTLTRAMTQKARPPPCAGPYVDQSHDPEGQAAAACGRSLGGGRLQGAVLSPGRLLLQDDVGVVGAGGRGGAVGGQVLAQEAAIRQEGVDHQGDHQGTQANEEVQKLWRKRLVIMLYYRDVTCDRVSVS